MATRSNIRVILKEEDRNRDMKFIPNEKQTEDLENEPWGFENLETGLWETVNPGGKEALVIYHHWDGYPEGVGKTLLEEYNSYEEALNLVLGGDCSSINGTYTPYVVRKGEDWDSIKPEAVDENYKMQEEYDYMFKDGEWFVRGAYHDDLEEWTPLKKVLNMEDGDPDIPMIETVRDLIKALESINPDAKVCIGDNFENRVELGYGGAEGCTKKNCEYLCLDIRGQENKEKE